MAVEYRPDGMAPTPGVRVDYSHVYDEDGREKLANGHARRTIGYFNGGRTGKNGQPAYLVPDIPWTAVTHINYAFAHIDAHNRISVGPDGADNPATGMTWPDHPTDPLLPYLGHFNLLTQYKRKHQGVRTLISVGGWAETGGIVKPDGSYDATGGFYKLAADPQAIATFAASVVEFLRKYGFDGVDIDYEYATSMKYAGNPLDFKISNANRATLVKGYVDLIKALRAELDRAAVQDGTYYLLTAAVSGSGWVLRGSETYQVTPYLDYVNIMSYDLHGSWNKFVGPNAALYDDGKDAELAYWETYKVKEFDGIGHLNADWAYHYFRGAMPAGRINLGVPFYTRGWQGVTGGANGLWGEAPLPQGQKCPDGTGETIGSKIRCGFGAVGIDNLWHDVTAGYGEVPAGVNPMWHAKNLQEGKQVDSYLKAYGLDPQKNPKDRLTGTYQRYYDSTLVAPWLWNKDKKVFLSIEDEESIAKKVEYVVDEGIGGLMIWELAGDFARDATTKVFGFGTTLVDTIHDAFVEAAPYGASKSNRAVPEDVLDVAVEVTAFPVGDANYPITPTLTITNNSKTAIPAKATIEFDYGTSAPGNMTGQSDVGLTVTEKGHSGPNVGGLKGDFQRVRFTVPAAGIPTGGKVEVKLKYYLPIATPSNFVITISGKKYAITHDHPRVETPPIPLQSAATDVLEGKKVTT